MCNFSFADKRCITNSVANFKTCFGLKSPTVKSVLISVGPPCGLKYFLISDAISPNESLMSFFALEFKLLL